MTKPGSYCYRFVSIALHGTGTAWSSRFNKIWNTENWQGKLCFQVPMQDVWCDKVLNQYNLR